MKKSKFNLRNRWSRKQARKAIPLFASFFLAQFPLPAGNTPNRHQAASFSPTAGALKFIQFELDVYQLYEEMGLEQTGLSLEVFNKAMVGYLNLWQSGKISTNKVLTIADFDKPSSEKRLWVLDLEAKKIIHHTLVAHGKNSGLLQAEQFSNVPNSEMSSLGFFVTKGTYQGKHGLSLKLEGQEERYNTNAAKRCVVVHGADYVSEDFVKQNGRLGRSQGCPALPMENHQAIINDIKGETSLYLHSSKTEYNSDFLNTEVAMNAYYAEAMAI
jgi:hypothetical protein